MRTSRIQSSASLPHFLEPKAFRGGQRLMEPPLPTRTKLRRVAKRKAAATIATQIRCQSTVEVFLHHLPPSPTDTKLIKPPLTNDNSTASQNGTTSQNTEGSGKQDQPKKIATAAAMNTKNTGEKPSTAEIEAKNTNKKDSSRPFRAPRATRRQGVQRIIIKTIIPSPGWCSYVRIVSHVGDGVKRSSLQQLVHNIAQRKEKLDPITVEEVEKHSTAEDAWCIVAGHVLNLNPLIEGKKRHPGGTKILEKIAGKDATSQFRMFHYPHGAAVRWASEEMYVGPLKTDNKSGGHRWIPLNNKPSKYARFWKVI